MLALPSARILEKFYISFSFPFYYRWMTYEIMTYKLMALLWRVMSVPQGSRASASHLSIKNYVTGSFITFTGKCNTETEIINN